LILRPVDSLWIDVLNESDVMFKSFATSIAVVFVLMLSDIAFLREFSVSSVSRALSRLPSHDYIFKGLIPGGIAGGPGNFAGFLVFLPGIIVALGPALMRVTSRRQ
jgi:hypothetical protein